MSATGLVGPSGWLTLLALLALFAIGVLLTARRTRLPVTLVGALVSFVASAVFGMSAVNDYYGYYQSWGQLWSDVAADNGAAVAPVTIPVERPSAAPSRSPAPAGPDSRAWHVLRLAIPGARSHVRHGTALVVLPATVTTPLPVLMLIHGQPGGADSWLGGLRLVEVLREQAAAGRIGPMAVVLPEVTDAFFNQQCLNATGAPQFGTFLAEDVPAAIQARLPVLPAGRAWLTGGLSEGGYCAADLVLHRPDLFAGAAILDGYFHPVLTRSVLRRAFRGDAMAARAEDPTLLVENWPTNRELPRFWIMAGTGNATDYWGAVSFATSLGRREDVRFLSVLKANHTTPAWRTSLPDLLRWAWSTLDGHSFGGSIAVPLNASKP